MPTILVFWFAQTWSLREVLLGAMVTSLPFRSEPM